MLAMQLNLSTPSIPTNRRSPIPFTPTGARTLYDNWTNAVERYGPHPCLGRRSGTAYSYITFAVRGALLVGGNLRQLVLCSLACKGSCHSAWLLSGSWTAYSCHVWLPVCHATSAVCF